VVKTQFQYAHLFLVVSDFVKKCVLETWLYQSLGVTGDAPYCSKHTYIEDLLTCKNRHECVL